MGEDQFAKLFKYMQKEFGHVRGDIQGAREDIVELKGAVAEQGGHLRDYHKGLLTARGARYTLNDFQVLQWKGGKSVGKRVDEAVYGA